MTVLFLDIGTFSPSYGLRCEIHLYSQRLLLCLCVLDLYIATNAARFSVIELSFVNCL